MEKRTLAHMRKSVKTEDETTKFPISGLYIISKIIEEQNKNLLHKIANKKISSSEEKEIFIEKFFKVCYHIPEIADNENQERLQQYLL